MEPMPQAAPLVFSHASRRDDASAYGIEMNVVADSRERVPVFDEQRFVSALKYMSVLTMESREADREGRLQPVHASHEIRLGCFQCEMVMVAHEHECAGPPAELHRRLAQRCEESSFRAVRGKNVVLQIATVDHMVTGSWILKAKTTRHSSDSAGSFDAGELRRYSNLG